MNLLPISHKKLMIVIFKTFDSTFSYLEMMNECLALHIQVSNLSVYGLKRSFSLFGTEKGIQLPEFIKNTL